MRAWIGALVNGLPAKRGDRMVRLGDVSATLAEIFSDRGHDAIIHVVNYNDQGFNSFGEHIQEFTSVRATSLATLFPENVPADAVMKQYGLASRTVAVLGICFFGMLVAAAAAGYYLYRQEQEKQRLAEIERQRLIAQNQPKPDQVYTDKFVKYFNNGPQRVSAQVAAQRIFKEYKSLEAYERGWKFSKFDCTFVPVAAPAAKPVSKPPPTCAVEYSRSAEAGKSPLTEEEYPDVEHSVDSVLAKRTLMLKTDPIAGIIPPQNLQDMFAPKVSTDLVIKQLRVVEDMKLAHSYKAPTAIPASDGQQAPSVGSSPFEIKKGDWSISGSYALYELLYDMPPSAFVENISFTSEKGAIMFKANGYFFTTDVHKATATIPAPAQHGPGPGATRPITSTNPVQSAATNPTTAQPARIDSATN
ncbi:hypothetical protein ACFQAT_25865 [Undibacterium arcticum]